MAVLVTILLTLITSKAQNAFAAANDDLAQQVNHLMLTVGDILNTNEQLIRENQDLRSDNLKLNEAVKKLNFESAQMQTKMEILEERFGMY